ncbi:MAG: TetR/AcrR family transcriptional regulator [Candidatus Saccharicenans sp.]|nr:MAG: hypothetical protein C0168_06040 [Candidatus Aminicenantes bacterium]
MKTKIVHRVSKENWKLKDRILEKSRELFFKYGYTRLSMDEIASRLAISKATLYRYFPDKKNLFQAVIKKTRTEIMTRLEAISTDENLKVKEKLFTFFTFISRFLSGVNRELIRDMQRHLPEIWQEIKVFRREKIFPIFSALVKEGVAQGEIKSDLDARIFLEMFFYLAGEFINPDWVLENDYSPSELISSIIRIVFYGIFTAEEPTKKDRSGSLRRAKKHGH